MSLTHEQMDRLIQEHFDFEAHDDVDGVVSTLADDAEHDVVGSPLGVRHGPQGARTFYERLFEDLKTTKHTTLRRYYGDDFMVVESLWEGIATGEPLGVSGRQRPVSFRLLHVLEFTEDAKIRRENVWLDQLALLQQLTDAAPSPAAPA